MLKISPSLINSFGYLYRAGNRAGMVDLLSKKRTPPMQAMLDGIAFEKRIYDLCDIANIEPANEQEQMIVDRVRWAKRQVWLGTEIKTYVEDFKITGCADAVTDDEILDIKRKQRYVPPAYKTSAQHIFYIACLGIEKFSYLIYDGKEFNEERYFYTQKQAIDETKKICLNFYTQVCNDEELKKIYHTNWSV